MNRSAQLERSYRRLLASYPRAFRREHEQEMIAVLMAGAGESRRHPGLAESVNLVGSAIRMRLRPGAPRSAPTVFLAVRLMYLGAVLELAALATVLLTRSSLRAAIITRHPGFTTSQWHAVLRAHVLPLEIGAPIAAIIWLWLAWANGRGNNWARLAFAGLFGLTSLSLLSGIAQGAVTYSPVDVIAGAVLWLVALVTVVLIFNRQSRPYYSRTAIPG
jgi:hypothetical protein